MNYSNLNEPSEMDLNSCINIHEFRIAHLESEVSNLESLIRNNHSELKNDLEIKMSSLKKGVYSFLGLGFTILGVLISLKT